MDSMQSSMSSVPELFSDYVEQIAASFVFIANRSIKQQEFKLFDTVMMCFKAITDIEKCRPVLEKYVD